MFLHATVFHLLHAAVFQSTGRKCFFVFSLLRPHPHTFLVLLRFPRLFFVSFSISIFPFHLPTAVSPPLLLFRAVSFLSLWSLGRIRPNTQRPTRCRRRFRRVSVSVARRKRGSGNKLPYPSFTGHQRRKQFINSSSLAIFLSLDCSDYHK